MPSSIIEEEDKEGGGGDNHNKSNDNDIRNWPVGCVNAWDIWKCEDQLQMVIKFRKTAIVDVQNTIHAYSTSVSMVVSSIYVI